MVRQIDANSPEAVAAREEEARRRRRDEEYVRQAYGLEPEIDPSTGQVRGRLGQPSTPPGVETIAGAGRGGVRGYMVTYTDSSGREQTKFQPEQVGGVTLTSRQAAVYAMGDGRTGQSITITSPDGHSVNYATGLDAIPNYYDEKAHAYRPLSAAQYARAHQAEIVGDAGAWKAAMDAVAAAYGAPGTPTSAATGAAPGGSGAPPAGGRTGGAGSSAGPMGRGVPSERAAGVTKGDEEDYLAAAEQSLHQLGVINADPYISYALIDRLALSKADARAITETFRAMPSVSVSGISLGQEIDYRRAAQSTLSGLGVFREVSADEVRRFAQGRADPGAIARYYRDSEPGQLGIGLGREQDYRSMAKRSLEQLGLTREPTDAEVRGFGSSGVDAEAVQRAYATSSEVRAINPGAAYGLSREQYQRERGEVERAAAATSGIPESAATTAESEPGYLREAFEERMAPAEIASGLEDVQRRLGTPPTAEDVKRIRTRQKVRTAEDRASPAGQRTRLGPTVGLDRPPREYVGPRRS